MLKFSRDLILVLLFSSLVSIGAVYFYHLKQKKAIVSPILKQIKLSISENIWLPKQVLGLKTAAASPEITAKSAYFVEALTGQVLYQKDISAKLPIASLAKVMTTIITLENKNWADQINISGTAAQMEPDKMLLIAGEKLTVEEILDGVFLVSANDAAEALAEQAVGNREEFISLMNKKAKQIGMNDTLFINPTGLEEDGRQQYSTAYDALLMARYAILKWPKLLDISANPHIFLPQNNTHQDYDLYSGINLLTTYPGVIGFKTGYTPEAGLTLITVAKRQDKLVIGVLLGATDRRDDARVMLDYSFKNWEF